MAFLGQTFDANSVEPSAPREIIPAGKYNAAIVASEMRDTKTGGKLLQLEMEITDGPYAKRRLWDRLNLVNANDTAAEIAHRTLSAICHATGKLTVSDSETLHFIPMQVTVKVRPAGKDKAGVERDAQNEVAGYAPLNGTTPTSAPAAASAQQQTGRMPWKRAQG